MKKFFRNAYASQPRTMQNHNLWRSLTVTLVLILAAPGILFAQSKETEEPAPPAIELGAPFTSHAILQRGMEVPVWGWSEPGTNVTVAFAGQSVSATADNDGKWMVMLSPLEADAEGSEMVISEKGGETRTLEDVLVGEIWMASGQSNMQWLAKASNASIIVDQLNAAAEDGKKAPIREFKVTNYFAHLHPIEHAKGAWNKDYGEFSAIALAFAHKVHEEIGVPVGILNCSFSQTAIEAWTPRTGYLNSELDYNKKIEAELLKTDPSTPEHEKAWNAFYASINEAVAKNQEIADAGDNDFVDLPTNQRPGNMQSNRDATWLFNARLNPVIPYALRGCIWNQGYANMNGGINYYANLHALVRGWRTLWDKPELPVYFHQFYSPGNADKGPNHPDIGSTAEMRLGTWLARDIPNTGMASQIDNQGAIHYRSKVVPGQRLALHALKNQYGKDVVADGPMYKGYTIDGNKLIVEFDHADDGLVVAESGSNYLEKKDPESTGFADPKIIENGADQVTLFYLAGEDRVWHPAKVTIDGDKAVVISDAVKEPRGVAYGTAGIGFQPNLYNKALLPATPFIVYDNELVMSDTWPDSPIQIAGVELDPSSVGLVYDYRKMPILSTQFRDDAVLQAGTPITFWGGAVHPWADYQNKITGEQIIHFSFNGIEETIPVVDGMKEWKYTVPAMEPSADPKTLKVSLSIDGETVHERVIENIVIGDVWYVAGLGDEKITEMEEPVNGPVRVLPRKAKGVKSDWVRQYSVATSTTPKNRFASYWGEPTGEGFAARFAKAIHAKTGNPVGIIYMDEDDLQLKHWMDVYSLANAPSLEADYKDIAAITPGTPYYKQNAERYIEAWKTYWGEYIPEMIATKAVPDDVPWGSFPTFAGKVETDATYYYNCLVASFKRTQLKGIVFMTEASNVAEADGAHFGEQMSALANGWKRHFKNEEDPYFFYTLPSKDLAPKITKPTDIKGKSEAYKIDAWHEVTNKNTPINDETVLPGLIDEIIKQAY